jgi:hypothetical protein
MDLASHFAVPDPAFRSIFLSDASLEPARLFPKTLDQGLCAVGFCHPGLDIPQPRQIRLAGIIAQSQLGILQFPK